MDYYNRYGQDVGRGPIKHKLKELITSDDVKEAISAVIDGIEIPPVPPTYLERVKTFLEVMQGLLLLSGGSCYGRKF